jgi:hypothetical protein
LQRNIVHFAATNLLEIKMDDVPHVEEKHETKIAEAKRIFRDRWNDFSRRCSFPYVDSGKLCRSIYSLKQWWTGYKGLVDLLVFVTGVSSLIVIMKEVIK